MALLVVFATDNDAVLKTVADRKASLLPNELRANGFAALGGCEPVISAFNTSRGGGTDAFLSWLDWRPAQIVVVLTDDTIPELVEELGDQFSVHRFTPPGFGLKVSNQLTSALTRCLRALLFLKARFDDLKYQQILRLPLRNFDAPEINRMRKLCRSMPEQGNYARDIDAILRDLRKRQKPKKASDRNDFYLVDDREKHFRLGHEIHAQADTKTPPHNLMCVISNRFRFGLSFNGTKHYNVSLKSGGEMKGKYCDCHNTPRYGGKGRHLNMFSNDFF